MVITACWAGYLSRTLLFMKKATFLWLGVPE